MTKGNFSDIDGLNAGPRREFPGLRAAVASALLAALGVAGWKVLPWAVFLILTVAP